MHAMFVSVLFCFFPSVRQASTKIKSQPCRYTAANAKAGEKEKLSYKTVNEDDQKVQSVTEPTKLTLQGCHDSQSTGPKNHPTFRQSLYPFSTDSKDEASHDVSSNYAEDYDEFIDGHYEHEDGINSGDSNNNQEVIIGDIPPQRKDRGKVFESTITSRRE